MKISKNEFCITKLVQEHQKTLKLSKIMHLQFLADYTHYQRFREKITDCTYKRNGERLFCDETDKIVTSLVEKDILSKNGKASLIFVKLNPSKSIPTDEKLTRHELESIEETCDKYMEVDTDSLKQNTTSLQIFQSTREQNNVL